MGQVNDGFNKEWGFASTDGVYGLPTGLVASREIEVDGGLRQRDTWQVQRCLFCFGGDKMDLQRTLDGATWPFGGSSHVGCCWGSVAGSQKLVVGVWCGRGSLVFKTKRLG
jgi:hypothetical protein